MPTLGIRQSTWQGLRQNQRDITQWAFTKLDLGQPALYKTPGGVAWLIFDDRRLDVLMFARLGTLANKVANLPKQWKVPTVGTGQDKRVDRPAVEAKAIELVQASIVLPDDITYPEDDPNPYQTTLDAQGAPSSVRGSGAVPADWTPPPGPSA